MLEHGMSPPSPDSGEYCRARRRLNAQVLRRLVREITEQMSLSVPVRLALARQECQVSRWLYIYHAGYAVQSESLWLPSRAGPRLWIPDLAFVGVFCLATRTALACALGRWSLHDLSLFCLVLAVFEAVDILLADRGFHCYVEMALMQKQGVDTVVRLHQRRLTDFRRGRILGLEDHLVTWTKPQNPPRRIRKKDFRGIPETLVVREIRYRVDVKGFRTQTITLATTLVDANVYPPEDSAGLYFHRWEVELDFRHIKITLQMDVLRCKSPQMVRKELWCHLLAYSLVRHLMWEAGQTKDGGAGRTSFRGTIQYLTSFRAFFCVTTHRHNSVLLNQVFDLTATQEVPYRPHRVEPRVKKRRPK